MEEIKTAPIKRGEAGLTELHILRTSSTKVMLEDIGKIINELDKKIQKDKKDNK